MANITLKDVEIIATHRDAIANMMRDAVATHRDAIKREIAAFDTRRDENAQRWAQLCIVKSILSSGADLMPNIALALILVDVLRDGMRLETYDDAEVFRVLARYTGRSVGQNIVNAINAWNNVLATFDPSLMNYQTLLALRNDRKIMGHAHKTRRWSLALYDARNRVFTLDVHMCRGLANLAGLERDGITDGAYELLEALMLDIHDDVIGRDEMPLVSQWAMWNEIRHAGQHAEHIALAD